MDTTQFWDLKLNPITMLPVVEQKETFRETKKYYRPSQKDKFTAE